MNLFTLLLILTLVFLPIFIYLKLKRDPDFRIFLAKKILSFDQQDPELFYIVHNEDSEIRYFRDKEKANRVVYALSRRGKPVRLEKSLIEIHSGSQEELHFEETLDEANVLPGRGDAG